VSPSHFLVLPEDKANYYAQELQRINISIIGFRWQEEKVVFSGLERIKID
jgi:hypothetical protein